MTFTYKTAPVSDSGNEQQWVLRVTDNVIVPFDPANTDYQEYLEWLAEGNEPLPADDPE